MIIKDRKKLITFEADVLQVLEAYSRRTGSSLRTILSEAAREWLKKKGASYLMVGGTLDALMTGKAIIANSSIYGDDEPTDGDFDLRTEADHHRQPSAASSRIWACTI